MPVIQSFGRLQTYGTQVPDVPMVRTTGYDQAVAGTYAAIYRTQPNVRTVIDFLARNIAQLGLHAFRRVSDLDRQRLASHDVLTWLAAPNPSTTQYRLMESTLCDLGIYFNAYWLKVRLSDRLGLVRLPPETVTVEGWLQPSAFVWTTPDYHEYRLDPRDVVYFNGYDPFDPLMGVSPLETLRQLLVEDAAAIAHRQAFWRNGAQLAGAIEIDLAAPSAKWNSTQRQAWREQWQQRFAGPDRAGNTALLEPGQKYTPFNSQTMRDAEFVAARKLTREEVAAAYHVPLPMVGILDHATFSNIREQHKQLYQDCLGPWLTMLAQELERQLLVESRDTKPGEIYYEFNIAEKMKGSFEEQAKSLQVSVGRPVMTPNEGRARLNLPRITDDPTADQLAMPLNTSTAALAPGADPDEAAA